MRALAFDDAMLVHQQCPTHLSLQTHGLTTVSHLSGCVATDIVAIVVVAKYRINAILGLQRTQDIHVLIDFLWLGVLDIASKDNHIRMLGIDTVDGPLQDMLISGCIRAHMGIREQHHLIPIEGLGQVRRGVGVTVYLQFVEAYKRAIEQDIPDDWHAEQAYQIAKILLRAKQSAYAQSHHREHHKHRLGDGNQPEQQQVDI